MNADVNRLAASLIPTSLGATNFDNYVAKYVPLRYRTPSPPSPLAAARLAGAPVWHTPTPANATRRLDGPPMPGKLKRFMTVNWFVKFVIYACRRILVSRSLN